MQVLSLLPLLETVILSHNEIEVIEHVQSLKQLQTLQLDNNRIREVPHDLVSLTKLEELLLENNDIRLLPSFLHRCHFPELSYLVLENNPIEDIPEEILRDPVRGLRNDAFAHAPCFDSIFHSPQLLHIIYKMETMEEVHPNIFQGGQGHGTQFSRHVPTDLLWRISNLEMDKELLKRHGITHIIGLNESVLPSHPGAGFSPLILCSNSQLTAVLAEEFKYLHVNLKDSLSENIGTHLDNLVNFVENALNASEKHRVLVHWCDSRDWISLPNQKKKKKKKKKTETKTESVPK